MSKLIRVKIITPSGVIFDQQAQMVVMPGELGEFAVLPRHELLIASLKLGVVKIIVDNNVLKYFIYSGLADISGININVVTEFAVDTDSLQLHEVTSHLALLKKEMDKEIDGTKVDIIKLDIAKYESLSNYFIQ